MREAEVEIDQRIVEVDGGEEFGVCAEFLYEFVDLVLNWFEVRQQLDDERFEFRGRFVFDHQCPAGALAAHLVCDFFDRCLPAH